ncbi:DUF4843 domain-containing protein [Pedobacter nyackensis]|uniref:DUF4843 domain-containing protein n=1 Tax=Pedobacter nyackensis TaxID=475255 RepID=UPI00292E5D40|nr:DUF4843 domain-containing protein [Pedobacter nyackensis]
MYKNFYLCVLALIMLSACKKEEIDLYNDKAVGNSIYFAKADTLNDLIVSFGYAKNEVKDSVVSLVIRTIGAPATVDRPYNLSVADSSTVKRGVDYDFLNTTFSIKAGKVTDTLKIKFHRTEQLAKDSLFLYLDLKPNEHFSNSYLSRSVTTNNVTQIKYNTRLKFKVDDIAGAPFFWTPASSGYSTVYGYYGAFSTRKYQLLISRYNLDPTDLARQKWVDESGNSTRLGAWALGLSAYLKQRDNAGDPVYEADGVTKMTLGIYAK